jgi:HSP20 family protein
MSNIDVWRNRSLLPSRFLSSPLSSNFFRRMDHLFEDLMNDLTEFGGREGALQNFEPACDLTEGDDDYQLCLDIPGLHAKDINVEVVGNTVVVSGERKIERKAEKGGTHYRERRLGAFERRVQMPDNVDADKIQAHFDAGVLMLKLPKSSQSQKKKINIIETAAHGGEVRIEAKKEAASEHKKSA